MTYVQLMSLIRKNTFSSKHNTSMVILKFNSTQILFLSFSVVSSFVHIHKAAHKKIPARQKKFRFFYVLIRSQFAIIAPFQFKKRESLSIVLLYIYSVYFRPCRSITASTTLLCSSPAVLHLLLPGTRGP